MTLATTSMLPKPSSIRVPKTKPCSAYPKSTLPPRVRAKRMVATVRAIAAQMSKRLPRHIEMEDLVGAGSLGLADAYTRRAGMSGPEFEAFAACRVRGAMLDELRRLDAMPRCARRSARRVAVAARAVEQKLGRPAGEEEIAGELGVDVEAYQAIRTKIDAHHAPVPFSAIGDGDDDFSQRFADGRNEEPETLTQRAQLSAQIAAKVSALPERMRTVLIELYAQETTLKNIGESLGVTESRVCQIHTEAIKVLRSTFVDGAKTRK